MRGIIIFLLFFNLIWADTVILKNGSVYEGRIIKETEKMIIIKIEIGEIGIPRDKIKEIEYDREREKISEILYQKAKTLYNKMEDKEKYTIKNIPQYRKIKELLEKAKEKTQNPETLKKIYPLLTTCYDHLAEYKRKHQTMKEYATLLYPKDREKQAEWIKSQADRLITEGETAEAVMLYHFIPYDYPESKTVSGCYFKLGELFEEKMDWERALKNYKFVLNNEVEENLFQKTLFRIGICYLKLNKNKKATEMFQEVILKYPESDFSGEVLYHLGRAYYNSGRKEKAKEVFNRYLKKKFPEGKYAKEVKFFIKFLGGER